LSTISEIDVILLTKNSVYPCLRDCLLSVKKEVPVKRLIVVDGCSSDETIDLCKSIFPDCEIILDLKGNRATSRQIGIENVKTEWFVFLDSDIILNYGWFKNISSHASNRKIGAIEGSFNLRYTEHHLDDFYSAMKKMRKILGFLDLPSKIERAFTGDTLIRTEVIKGISIPNFLHVYEDQYIKSWIEKKGYIWLKAPKALCIHCRGAQNPNPIAAYSDSYFAFAMGYRSFTQSLFATLILIPKLLLALAIKPNFKMALWQSKFGLYSFIGVSKAKLNKKCLESFKRGIM